MLDAISTAGVRIDIGGPSVTQVPEKRSVEMCATCES
jgi:hypothetical protein